MMLRFVLLTLSLLPGLALADSDGESTPELVPFESCFMSAAKMYSIDPALLVAIANVESGISMDAVNSNANGSIDYGVMQINSRWEGPLQEQGINFAEVKTSPCLNIHVGAWVLASNFANTGIDWFAVGAYNAGYSPKERSRAIRRSYASKVYKSYLRVTARFDNLESLM